MKPVTRFPSAVVSKFIWHPSEASQNEPVMQHVMSCCVVLDRNSCAWVEWLKSQHEFPLASFWALLVSVSQTGFRGNLGFRKWCQRFREMNMRNGGRVLFGRIVVSNLYMRTKIRVATVDTNHSVTDIAQILNRCFNPETSWFYSQVSQHSSP